ncbi:MAG: hypothetical protein ABJZ55_13900, partial [Fuerstiella sp.]
CEHTFVLSRDGIAPATVQSNEKLREGDNLKFNKRSLKGAVTAKIGGRVLRRHANDPDPFPSTFHAHDLETGEKIDLETGLIYPPGSKHSSGSLSKKDLATAEEKLKRE